MESAKDLIVRTRSHVHDPLHVKNASSSWLLRAQSTPHVRERSQMYMAVCMFRIQTQICDWKLKHNPMWIIQPSLRSLRPDVACARIQRVSANLWPLVSGGIL